MKRPKLSIGDRIGKLTITGRAGHQGKHVRFLCRCDCGANTAVQSGHLKGGYTRSCGGAGCREWRKSGTPRKQVHDLAGQRRGRLLILERDLSQGCTRWRCQCDCGRIVLIPSESVAMRRTCGHRDCAGNASASTGPKGGEFSRTKVHERTRSIAGMR